MTSLKKQISGLAVYSLIHDDLTPNLCEHNLYGIKTLETTCPFQTKRYGKSQLLVSFAGSGSKSRV